MSLSSKSIATGVLLAALAALAGSATQAAPMPKVTMSCRDFVALDPVIQPKVVYWAEGLNNKGKPEDAVIDYKDTERLVPVVVQSCRAHPTDTFWDRMRADWNRMMARM